MRHRQPEGDGSARFRSMGRVDVLAACSTGRISCRQMALTLHWGVARDAVAERCASGRAAALQHLVAPKRLHSGRLYIVYNTGQAPRTYVRAMRECDTPRPVTFLEGGGPVGLRVSAVITGKPVGCGRRLGIGLGGEGTWMWSLWCTGVWRGKGNRARE